jgi:hypothetical protein
MLEFQVRELYMSCGFPKSSNGGTLNYAAMILIHIIWMHFFTLAPSLADTQFLKYYQFIQIKPNTVVQ